MDIHQIAERLLSLKGFRITCFTALLLLTASVASAMEADTVRIKVTEGTNLAIALSPDKGLIAMDIQGTIWVMPVTGGKARAITDALGDCRQPTWSSDGNLIAFQSYRDGNYHIWMVNKDGSGLTQITTGIFHDREPSWSSDGKSIVFSSDRSGNYDIWKVDLATRVLTQLTRDQGNDYFPVYAADGSKLAYVSERNAASGIYLFETGSEPKLFVHSKERLFSPAWHPNGTHISFNTLLPGKSQLEFVKMGGGDWQTLSDSTEDVFPFKVAWLSETEYLYTADGVVKRKKLGQKQVTVIPFEAEIALGRDLYKPKARNFDTRKNLAVQGIRSPIVSPDGQDVAFTALGDLWILKKGNPKPLQLTNDPNIELDPVWSPDGKQLVYTSDKNGNMDLWTREVASGKETLLLDAADNVKFPGWAPDGATIAFYQADPKAYSRNVLNLMDVNTKKVTTIYSSLFEGSQPSWFPDGKRIVISALDPYSTRFREGLSKFLIIPIDKSEAKFVSPVPERTLATRGKNGPAVSPDGRSIAYVLDNTLWLVAVEPNGSLSGPPKRMTNELAEDPSWAGDSKSLVFLATDILKRVHVETGVIETLPFDFTWKIRQPSGVTIIHAGRVFNGRSEKYLENVDVVIEGNRIKSIEPHKAGRKGQLVDASMQTLVPGLFEMHTHQNAYLGEKGGRLWLGYGITSIREPGTDAYDALERKEAWASGKRKGPRTFFTGGHMEGSRVYYNRSTSNVGGAQLDLELGRAVKLGYDLIKTYVGLPDVLQERVTKFAHANGIPVSSHELYPAVGYGVDAVEHIGATSRRGYSPKLTALNNSYQDLTEMITRSGMYITPTISLHGGMNALIQSDTAFFSHWQFKSYYSESLKAELKGANRRGGGGANTYLNIERSLMRLLKSGARVTPGTDSPIIPSALSYHAELQSWVKAGASPFQTLRAATLWCAEEIGVAQDLGTIEPGKLADIVIVHGDPLKDIKDMLRVHMVLKNGELFSVDSLKRMD